MTKLLLTAVLIYSITSLGCQSDVSTRKIVNPNGDSELAILMRDMYDEGMLIKQDIIEGKEPKMKVNYHLIHTATPTEEGKNTTPEYIHFAKAYEEAVAQFKNASETERSSAYQNMVQNCMNCHNSICPGPMVRIEKMYLPEDEISY